RNIQLSLLPRFTGRRRSTASVAASTAPPFFFVFLNNKLRFFLRTYGPSDYESCVMGYGFFT
ncbi:unnamed protein product, partial [Urochloa humidicola]